MTTLTAALRAVRAQLAPVRSTARGGDWSRVRIALRVARDNPSAKRIRVYSGAGFVPNAYRHQCRIQFVELRRAGDEWRLATGWTGAQRSCGAGSLVVVR